MTNLTYGYIRVSSKDQNEGSVAKSSIADDCAALPLVTVKNPALLWFQS